MSGSRVDEGVNPSAVLTGAKVTFYLGNSPVAYASAVNVTINHGLVPIHTIDRLAPVEYAETDYTVSFSVTRFRVPRNSSRPGTGSPVDLGWQSKVQNMLTQGTISARIYDKTTQQDALVIEEVKMTTRAFSIAARDIGSETLDFVGIVAYDEAGVQNAI
jgi:hypothetical protein